MKAQLGPMRLIGPVTFAVIAVTTAAIASASSSAAGAIDATAASTTTTAAAAPAQASGTKIRIRVGTRTLTATLARNATARDFLSRLPLSLRMRDFLAREKVAPLPRSLARGGTPRYAFSAGDIAYSPSRSAVVVYYRRVAVPRPGLVLIARLDSSARHFSVPGTAHVRIERVPTAQPARPAGDVVGTIVRFSSTRTSVDVTIGQDNPAVRDFLSMLPMAITVEEYAGREKISYLPRRLRHRGSPGSDPKDGDLIYFIPWGNLGFYYDAAGIGYSTDTIHIGTYDASREQLERLEGRVTVRVIDR